MSFPENFAEKMSLSARRSRSQDLAPKNNIEMLTFAQTLINLATAQVQNSVRRISTSLRKVEVGEAELEGRIKEIIEVLEMVNRFDEAPKLKKSSSIPDMMYM